MSPPTLVVWGLVLCGAGLSLLVHPAAGSYFCGLLLGAGFGIMVAR